MRPDVALGMPFGLLNAPHQGRELREHAIDRAQIEREGKADRRSCREEQQFFKFLIGNRLDEGLANLGEEHPIKGIVGNQVLANEPVKERTGRSSVGLNRSFTAHFATRSGHYRPDAIRRSREVRRAAGK